MRLKFLPYKVAAAAVVGAIVAGALNITYLETRQPSIGGTIEIPVTPTESEAPMSDAKSIAVLAFADLSPAGDQGYFSDGFSEELLTTLAQMPQLRVISRSSAFSFKGKDVGIPEIARQLDVALVLEGSVRREGEQVRIAAQLIDAQSDSYVWSDTYDRDLDSIFAVQSEIAEAIGGALKVTLELGGGKTGEGPGREADGIDAYDAYLLGIELFHNRGVSNVEEALRHFERAVRLDDDFALGHAQAAIATAMLGVYGDLSPGDVNRKASRHLARAEELEPGLAEVHAGRALLAWSLDDDSESAAAHARRALAINPSYSDARNWLSTALSQLGRYQEADAEIEQLLVNDPLNLAGQYKLLVLHGMKGRNAEAHELADKLVTQSPRMGYQAHANVSILYEGRIADGLAWQLMSNREQGVSDSDFLYWMFDLIGEREEAHRIDSGLTYWDDFERGRDEDGIRKLQRLMELDSHDKRTFRLAADVLFNTGHVDLSLPLYERVFEVTPAGRPLDGPVPVIHTIKFAVARDRSGDEAGAEALMQIARQDQAARRAAGRSHATRDTADAMIAMVDKNPDRAIAFLDAAIDKGLRDRWWLREPVFDELRLDPRFSALQDKLASIIALEREKALQLICFNNPVPENWQPMPETCESVPEQSSL